MKTELTSLVESWTKDLKERLVKNDTNVFDLDIGRIKFVIHRNG